MLMERGLDREYLPDPAKSLFIVDSPEQEEVANREFDTEGSDLNLVGGTRRRIQHTSTSSI